MIVCFLDFCCLVLVWLEAFKECCFVHGCFWLKSSISSNIFSLWPVICLVLFPVSDISGCGLVERNFQIASGVSDVYGGSGGSLSACCLLSVKSSFRSLSQYVWKESEEYLDV